MKKIFLVCCCLIPGFIQAQNEVDALRYSWTSFGGTSRYSSMGGAFSALGGDPSVAATNPGGLAIFRKTDFSLSTGGNFRRTTSDFYQSSNNDSKFNLYLSNASVIFTFPRKKREDETGWISGNLGFGYNRTTDFNQRINISAMNPNSSLTKLYLDQANNTSGGIGPSALNNLFPFDAGLAFGTYLIDTIANDSTKYFSQIPNGGVRQVKSILTRGGIGETFISLSGNYAHRLYLGASIGISNVNYYERSEHSETDSQDTILYFKTFKLNQSLTTYGSGYNIKLGFIYRLADWVRIGGSIHSPTLYTLTDNYSSKLSADYDNATTFTKESPDGEFTYSLATPFRAIGSLGFIIQKQGLITAEIDYSDYSLASLYANSESFSTANSAIDKKYRSVVNFRAGAEYKINAFALRAGVGYYPSPYSKGVNTDAHRLNLSAGFGIRENNYYVDFAFIRTSYKELYYLYNPVYNLSPVTNRSVSGMLQATVGYSF